MATEEQIAAIRRLHAEGMGRNAIARELQMGARQVSDVCREHGLQFERAFLTRKATETRAADYDKLRVELANLQIEDAHRLRKQLWEPATIYNFGGRDNTFNEVEVERPTFEQQLKIQQATVAAANNAMRLMESLQGANRGTMNIIIATARKLGLSEVDGE